MMKFYLNRLKRNSFSLLAIKTFCLYMYCFSLFPSTHPSIKLLPCFSEQREMRFNHILLDRWSAEPSNHIVCLPIWKRMKKSAFHEYVLQTPYRLGGFCFVFILLKFMILLQNRGSLEQSSQHIFQNMIELIGMFGHVSCITFRDYWHLSTLKVKEGNSFVLKNFLMNHQLGELQKDIVKGQEISKT